MKYDFKSDKRKEDNRPVALKTQQAILTIDNTPLLEALGQVVEKVQTLNEQVNNLELKTEVTTEHHEHIIETKDIDISPVVDAIRAQKLEVTQQVYDDSQQIKKLNELREETGKLAGELLLKLQELQNTRQQIPIQKAGRKTDPSTYIPVRLTDGKNFYSAVRELTTAMNNPKTPFVNQAGVQSVAKTDSQGHLITSPIADTYKQRIEYDVSGNAIYVGAALAGTATDATGWQIKKLTYDGSGNATAIDWAESSNSFNFVWDSRAGYTYS
jgi:YD repeat-containing protein